MPELSFSIGQAAVAQYAAAPTIRVPLLITNAPANESVQSILLNCQVQLEPQTRSYSAAEEARLLDLFGERSRWARTMKPMLWTNTVLKIPTFVREVTMGLLLPCTMDFEVATTKYFYGLEEGSIQISVLFSGTVFFVDERGLLQTAQIFFTIIRRSRQRARATISMAVRWTKCLRCASSLSPRKRSERFVAETIGHRRFWSGQRRSRRIIYSNCMGRFAICNQFPPRRMRESLEITHGIPSMNGHR